MKTKGLLVPFVLASVVMLAGGAFTRLSSADPVKDGSKAPGLFASLQKGQEVVVTGGPNGYMIWPPDKLEELGIGTLLSGAYLGNLTVVETAPDYLVLERKRAGKETTEVRIPTRLILWVEVPKKSK
jgi:hypothetical protein